jgi:hypothetical protein
MGECSRWTFHVAVLWRSCSQHIPLEEMREVAGAGSHRCDAGNKHLELGRN